MWPFNTSKRTLAEAIQAELADGDNDPLPSADTFRLELENDPMGYGYAALVSQGDDQSLADILNLVRDEIRVKVPVPQRSIIKCLAGRLKLRALKTAADNANVGQLAHRLRLKAMEMRSALPR